jgi:hypothetical protein
MNHCVSYIVGQLHVVDLTYTRTLVLPSRGRMSYPNLRRDWPPLRKPTEQSDGFKICLVSSFEMLTKNSLGKQQKTIVINIKIIVINISCCIWKHVQPLKL